MRLMWRFCQHGLCLKQADEGWMTCDEHRGQHWTDALGHAKPRP